MTSRAIIQSIVVQYPHPQTKSSSSINFSKQSFKNQFRYLNVSQNDDCFYFTTVAYSIMNTEQTSKNIFTYNSRWLYTLQLYIAGNFQLLKSHYQGRKSSKYFKDFTDLDFFYTDIYFSFSLRNACLPYKCLVTQSVCCTLSSQPFSWLGDT